MKITSFPATNGNLVIKLTIKYVYGFSGTSLNFSFPTSASILFFIHNHPHISLHYLLLLVISNSLLLALSSSIFLYVLLLAHYDASRLSLPSTPHLLIYILFLLLTPNFLLSAIGLLIILLLLPFSSPLLL